MTKLRLFRRIAWSLVLALALSTGVVIVHRELGSRPPARDVADGNRRPIFGGPFAIEDVFGRRVTERDLVGRPSLLFFGFTHCPDICPTTLSDISEWFDRLGDDGRDLIAYFVTIDPERDTPAFLREYLDVFDGRIVGLVGTEAQTRKIAEAWRVLYRRTPLDGGGYTMDHTASVFLIDRTGRFAGTIDFHEDRDVAIAKLRHLVGEPPR